MHFNQINFITCIKENYLPLHSLQLRAISFPEMFMQKHNIKQSVIVNILS